MSLFEMLLLPPPAYRSAEKVFDHRYHYESLMEIAQDVHLDVLRVHGGGSPGDSDTEDDIGTRGGV